MNPAQKALWFIESHLAAELTLDEIAGVAGISRFHMVRAFAAATGLSVMRYVRARRLSEAARSLAAGVGERYTCESSAGIPGQWQRFHQTVENIPGRIGKVAYGVCCNGDDAGNFDYIAGVEVSDFSDLPREFSRVRIPEQRYAVFDHRDHVSTIRRTVNTIWNHWLPASGLKAADAPFFERYDEKFDPLTGNGGLEIWIAVKE